VRTLGTADNPADLELDGADLLVSFGSGLLQRIDSTDGNVKSQINFNVKGGNDLLANSNELAVTLVGGRSVGFAERALISSRFEPDDRAGRSSRERSHRPGRVLVRVR
jgi:hypothetical protein